MKPLDRTLAALADPTRRGVVDLLRRGPRRAGELAEELAVSPPALSRHLKILRRGGLVEEERAAEAAGRDARVRVYRLRPQPFHGLQSWLAQVQAFWEGELASFKEHAERTRGPAQPRRRGGP